MARILITSGPTRQYLDPVRYLTNASSGRMGRALAAAAIDAGHEVVIVSGPVSVEYPPQAEVIPVISTEEMLAACQKVFPGCDGLIGVAAPCDYRPIQFNSHKIKRTGDRRIVELEETPDILATLGAQKKPPQWMVAFALETNDPRTRAVEKLRRKNCDLVVLNSPAAIDAAETQVEVLDPCGTVVASLGGSKDQVAAELVRLLQRSLIGARPSPLPVGEGDTARIRSLERHAVEIDCLCAGILFTDYICAPIPRMPEAGELMPTESIKLALGGCASNAGLDLAKLGVRVGVSGCVGDDAFGQFVVQTLEAGKVDVSGIHCLSGVGTASTIVVNVKGQDRRFISTPGANTRFTVRHIPSEWVRQAKVFYVGGYLMMPGIETDEFVDLLRTLRANGAKTVIDVVLFGGDRYWQILKKVLPETDVFLPNDDEAAIITGQKDPVRQAECFREAGAKTVVITQGKQGSILLTDGLRLRSGVYPVEYIGGTGSGDAFDAGYITGLLNGEDPAGCLRWGAALGASCVRSLSATESVFNRAEAEAFMCQHELPIVRF